MRIPRQEGILRVTQLAPNSRNVEELIRDFDAQEWSYRWVSYGHVTILHVMHDNADGDQTEFEFVEFSPPAQVEFIPID